MKSTHDRVTTTRRFGTGTMTRIVAGGIAAGSVVGLFAAAGPAGAADEPHKSYVCKFVSIPGEAERLQTGQNPIFVDNHALFRSNEDYNAADGLTYVGQQFNDKQVKSVVVVANTEKLDPEPSVSVCQTTPPTSPTSSTSSTSSASTSSTSTSSTSTSSTSSTSSTTSTTSSSSTTTPPETITTATLIPPTSSTSTTTSTSPTSTTTTSPATTTMATLIPPTTSSSTTTPATVATLYPLQPVNAGANSDGTSREVTVTPLRAALVLLVLFGLWVAFGGRLPHVNRIGSSRDGS